MLLWCLLSWQLLKCTDWWTLPLIPVSCLILFVIHIDKWNSNHSVIFFHFSFYLGCSKHLTAPFTKPRKMFAVVQCRKSLLFKIVIHRVNTLSDNKSHESSQTLDWLWLMSILGKCGLNSHWSRMYPEVNLFAVADGCPLKNCLVFVLHWRSACSVTLPLGETLDDYQTKRDF